MLRKLTSQIEIQLDRYIAGQALRQHIQSGNVIFSANVARLLYQIFFSVSTLETVAAHAFPFRPPSGFAPTAGRGTGVASSGSGPNAQHPSTLSATPDLNVKDYSRLRMSRVFSKVSSDQPQVIGSILAVGNVWGGTATSTDFAQVVAQTDVPARQIGVPYLHPVYTGTVSTTVGQPYLTTLATVSGYSGLQQSTGSLIRIESGADKGVYIVRHWDKTNSRLYLSNLDGTLFSASATASLVPVSMGVRLAYFNETGVIPNGVGAASFDGTYDPGENRTSYLVRLIYEKSGSPSPADANQTGSYWFTTRPFLFGLGVVTGNTTADHDNGSLTASEIRFGQGLLSGLSAGAAGGSYGMVLDRTNQRLWWTAADLTKGSFGWWRYKTPEILHEVASSSGTPNDPLAGIDMTGSLGPRGIDIGTDETVYVALGGGASCGVVAIKSDLSVTQFLTSSAGLGSTLTQLKVDRSRYRNGGAATASTVAAGGTVNATDGAFTQADVGRVIQLAGLGADSGNYKIATVVSGTQITVQTLAGGAVTFAGAAGGTFKIGDRIYLFWSDGTTGAGKITYLESIGFGSYFTRVVAMTNGATYYRNRNGDACGAAVDQATGALYWLSSDTAQQVNRYDPATNTHARRAISDFTGLNGGAGSHTAPTVFTAIGCNPHASFRDLWLGFDAGFVKLSLDSFAGAYSRYQGNGISTAYANPAGYLRPSGYLTLTADSVRWIGFGIDGRVHAMLSATTNGNSGEVVVYNREQDLWTSGLEQSADNVYHYFASPDFVSGAQLITPYGELVEFAPGGASERILRLLNVTTHYQYIGGVWTPKEVVRGILPGALSTGLQAKDLHTTLEDLVYGVKVKFTPQGGATPANNEFLGRSGQVAASRADGATTNASANFDGSGFSAADVGRFLRIHGGADAGVYVVSTFVNANRVTLKKLNPGTAWTATATAGTLTYSLWEAGALAGPEAVSVVLADGFLKDNTQDISGIGVEFFFGRTVLSSQLESPKACLPPVGPPKSAGPRVYRESYSRVTNPNYSPGIPGHLALPGAALTDGLQLIDGTVDDATDGTNGRATATGETPWGGRAANAATAGTAFSVDLGADAEVGTVIVRGTSVGSPAGLLASDGSTTYNGSIMHLLAAKEAGGAPAASSVIRQTGTGLTGATGSSTISLGTGDFLGTLAASGADGVTTSGANTFAAAPGTFLTSHLGMVLKILGGVDTGSYRILTVNGDGSQVTVRNLDQSSKLFASSASSLAFEVRDAVREDDMIAVPALAGATHKLSVERLLTPTTAQIRVTPSATITNQGWQAVKPTWDVVKRVSHSVEATAPDAAANGTYVSTDGKEAQSDSGWKAVIDLSDLSSSARTGRYWKFSVMSRFANATTTMAWHVNAIEFYDPSGKRLELAPDSKLDTVDSQPSFFSCHVTRFDFLQATDAVASHVAGSNGLAALGGTAGDTITLAGANRFLGRQVRAGATGSAPGGSNVFNIGGTDPVFISSDVGRILRIISGPNAGYYRILTQATGTQVTLVTPAGNAVTLAADAGPSTYALHEGIAFGGANPDVIALSGGLELTILTLSDDLKTITTLEKTYRTLTNQTWEIRRRGFPSSATAADSTYNARILYSANAAPRQSGDVSQDSKGYLMFHSTDVGGVTRTDGATTVGTANFDGSGFTPDDVGRALVIGSGADRGVYRIASYVSPTRVTLKHLWTGVATTLAATAGTLSYTIQGERVFRIARYVTVLRG